MLRGWFVRTPRTSVTICARCSGEREAREVSIGYSQWHAVLARTPYGHYASSSIDHSAPCFETCICDETSEADGGWHPHQLVHLKDTRLSFFIYVSNNFTLLVKNDCWNFRFTRFLYPYCNVFLVALVLFNILQFSCRLIRWLCRLQCYYVVVIIASIQLNVNVINFRSTSCLVIFSCYAIRRGCRMIIQSEGYYIVTWKTGFSTTEYIRVISMHYWVCIILNLFKCKKRTDWQTW